MASSSVQFSPGGGPPHQGLTPGTFTDTSGTSFDPTKVNGYQGLLNSYHQKWDQPGNDAWNGGQVHSTAVSDIGSATNQFQGLFNNYVGRAPTQDEVGNFYQNYLGTNIQNLGNVHLAPSDFRNGAVQYISDNYQQAAQQTAQSKLSAQQTQYGSLADQFMAMGQSQAQQLQQTGQSMASQFGDFAKSSLSDLTSGLQDYASRLFDRLKPNLDYMAQQEGIANSGGQIGQQQGALYDLGTAAMSQMIPLQQQLAQQQQGIIQQYTGSAEQTLQNAIQQANAIRFGGSSAPISLASSFAANQPGILSGVGTGALDYNNKAWQDAVTYARQVAMQQMQNSFASSLAQPGMLSNLGNSFATSFGSSAGKQATQFGMGSMNSMGNAMMSNPSSFAGAA